MFIATAHFLHAFKVSMESRRQEQFPERIFLPFICDELESSLCIWKSERTVAIAVLETVLQRPFASPERQFSLIFLHSAKLKTEVESQIYCSEMRRLYLHKMPSNLLQFIKHYSCSPEISPKHQDRKRPLAFLPCRDKHTSRLVSCNPGEGFLLSIRLELVCVSHSQSACGGQENIFYSCRKSNSHCPDNVCQFTA